MVRLTSGRLFHYPGFSQQSADSLIQDVSSAISRIAGFEGILKVRCSTGFNVLDYHGSFYRREAGDVDLVCIDTMQTVSVELIHDGEQIDEQSGVFVQAVLL